MNKYYRVIVRKGEKDEKNSHYYWRGSGGIDCGI